jgi:hypothetical protein
MNWYAAQRCDEIIGKLTLLSNDLYRKWLPDGQWTLPVKQLLRDIGHDRKFQVWASPGKEEFDFHGWLFDLCWARSGDPWPSFKGLSLACEIEWSRSRERHLEDFCKLAVADADFRLFIFASKSYEQAADDLKEIKAVSMNFPRTPGKPKCYVALAIPDDGPSKKPLPMDHWEV